MSLIYTSSSNNSSLSSGGKSSSGISTSKRNSIYIGGRSDAKSLEKLERWGISHILNVTTTKDSSVQAGVPNFFERKGQRFTYKRIPVYDSPTSVPQLESSITDIIKFISNGLFHGSVLVHCQHGVSRSTTCVVLYLMAKVGLSLQDSMKIIQRRRPEAKPIPAFYQLLERYETKLTTINNSNSNSNNNKRDDTTLGGREGEGEEEEKTKMKKKKKTKKSTSTAAAAAAAAMIGPAIGPTMMTRPQQIGPTIGPGAPSKRKTPLKEAEPSSRKRMIGPSIGPAIMKKDDPSTTTTTTTQPSSSSSSSAIIGPAIGPEMKKRKGLPSSSSSSLKSKTKEPIIGPAIGPPAIMKEEPERSSSSSSLLSSPSTTKKEE